MPFTDKPQVFSASINTLSFGPEGKEVSLGGSNVYPLYSFDAPLANPVRIGIQVSDKGFDPAIPGLAKFYEGCTTIAEQAVRAASAPGVDFVALSLNSADPNEDNASVDECAATALAVSQAIDKPLVIMGCKNVEKDSELFVKIADVLRGQNALFLSCREEDYKTVGASVVLAGGSNLGGESAVDINLAKQLNVLLSQLGVPAQSVVMNVGSSAAGYGFEYLSSTLDRVKAAALAQNDAQLQMPIATPISPETWGVKESMSPEEESPEWGSLDERGIEMEVCTASACLIGGSELVIMKHPAAVATIAKFIDSLM